MKTFPLSSKRQGLSFTSLIFNIVLRVLATVIREETDVQRIQIGKEELKLSLFANDMILYMKTLKTLLENNYSSSMNLVSLQDTKLVYRNLLPFCTPITNS